MADKDKNSGKDDNASFDSNELFESLFRDELDAIKKDKPEKAGIESTKRRREVKGKRQMPPRKTDEAKAGGPNKALEPTGKDKPEAASQKKISKRPGQLARAKPSPPVQKRQGRPIGPIKHKKKDGIKGKGRPSPTPGISSKKGELKKGENADGTKGDRIVSLGKSEQIQKGFKVGLLFLLLVVLAAVLINYSGIVDFGKLIGSSDAIKERQPSTPAAARDEKQLPHAAKPAQESSVPARTGEAPSPQKPRIVKKRPKSVTFPREPIIAEKISKPPTAKGRSFEVEETSAPKEPPQPVPPQKTWGVPEKPSKVVVPPKKPPKEKQAVKAEAYSPEKHVVSKVPIKPASAPKKPVAAEETPKSAAPTSAKEEPPKGELFPEERALFYPYSVYLGSYQSLGHAKNVASGYKDKGLSTYWVKVDLATKGVWFRVFAGHFKTRKEAEKLIKEKGLKGARVSRSKSTTAVITRTTADELNLKVASHKAESPDRQIVLYPYSIYLGSYQTVDRANKAVSLNQKKGLSPYWVKVNLGKKGIWFRVFTGHFRDKGEAEAYIRQKQLADAEVKRTRYAALVGTYTKEEDLREQFLALSKLGYSPYFIDQKFGESQLYVGAYYTKAGAERQRAELASKGIQSHVAER